MTKNEDSREQYIRRPRFVSVMEISKIAVEDGRTTHYFSAAEVVGNRADAKRFVHAREHLKVETDRSAVLEAARNEAEKGLAAAREEIERLKREPSAKLRDALSRWVASDPGTGKRTGYQPELQAVFDAFIDVGFVDPPVMITSEDLQRSCEVPGVASPTVDPSPWFMWSDDDFRRRARFVGPGPGRKVEVEIEFPKGWFPAYEGGHHFLLEALIDARERMDSNLPMSELAAQVLSVSEDLTELWEAQAERGPEMAVSGRLWSALKEWRRGMPEIPEHPAGELVLAYDADPPRTVSEVQDEAVGDIQDYLASDEVRFRDVGGTEVRFMHGPDFGLMIESAHRRGRLFLGSTPVVTARDIADAADRGIAKEVDEEAEQAAVNAAADRTGLACFFCGKNRHDLAEGDNLVRAPGNGLAVCGPCAQVVCERVFDFATVIEANAKAANARCKQIEELHGRVARSWDDQWFAAQSQRITLGQRIDKLEAGVDATTEEDYRSAEVRDWVDAERAG